MTTMHKTRMLFAALAASLITCTAEAQSTTNAQGQVSVPPGSTNLVQLLGLPDSFNTALATVESGFVDAAPYISNGIVTLEAGGLYNASDKHGKFGGFLDLTVPTSQQSGVGVGAGYLNGQLLDASVSLKLGTTTSLPLVGTVYAYISEGPDYNFQAKSIGNYGFVGFVKKFTLLTKVDPTGKVIPSLVGTFGAGVGNVSTLPGETIAFGASLTKTF